MFKSTKMKKEHFLTFLVMIAIVATGIFFVSQKTPKSEPLVQAIDVVEETSPKVDDLVKTEVEPQIKTEVEPNATVSSSDRNLAPSSTPYNWVWDTLPETVTAENNYYGGAKTVELSKDISIHICWCYGIRVLDVNPDKIFKGEDLSGHFVWTREGSHDLVLTDKINYFAVYDYEKKITSTLAKEGSRAYRFKDWSAYFFSDGVVSVTDSEGTVTVMEDGVFKLDPLADWRFEVLPEELIAMDQQFMMKLLIHDLPWN